MDNAEVIETAEQDVARLVNVLHKNGLTFWQILRIFLDYCQKLQMQAEGEYWQGLK